MMCKDFLLIGPFRGICKNITKKENCMLLPNISSVTLLLDSKEPKTLGFCFFFFFFIEISKSIMTHMLSERSVC